MDEEEFFWSRAGTRRGPVSFWGGGGISPFGASKSGEETWDRDVVEVSWERVRRQCIFGEDRVDEGS